MFFIKLEQNVLVILFKLNCNYHLRVFNASSYMFPHVITREKLQRNSGKIIHQHKTTYKPYIKTKIAIKGLCNTSLGFKIIQIIGYA